MAFADEQSYEEMINTLQTFLSQAGEQCDVMQSAGEDCVDNTENDPAAEKASAKLQQCLSKIRDSMEAIQAVIQALQDELEDIRQAAARANFDD